ncbi:alpha-galactosidase [Serinibacter arcticus]|uniref:Alpha-galactosidase n=1 Tax=Serinibacter arcticus TaxID=1655435 RepID=A0A2U1ZSE0_9MICO|nr:glycoside hydrolase family 36 protein [Serinibacter arcticus]PWD49904.1 alpha-galactosidase [Serinibacter arcticus]
MPEFTWSSGSLVLAFAGGDNDPVRLCSMLPRGGADGPAETDQPLVELSAFGHGRFPGGFRHVDTVLGRSLRYVGHDVEGDRLTVRQHEPTLGLDVRSVVETTSPDSVRTWTEVTRTAGQGEGDVVLDFVSSFATGAVLPDSGAEVEDLDLVAGANDWVAESRWSTRPLREVGLARIDRELQHHAPRSRYHLTNRGSWSTGEALPTAVVTSRSSDYAMGFQVEHNGPWLHEIGETRTSLYVLASGPTDAEHQWSVRLTAGETFVTPAVGVAVVRGGADDAFGTLTAHRRGIRRQREADLSLPVVFNDYMNTLMGDPTTAKLIPLIEAAGKVGVDIFCIDAGWYADGTWWDSVGEWLPAADRFPGGLEEVLTAITDRGMAAGLWLEPEVIGVNSPLARTLPEEAFFSRGGIRLAEHGRHLLDLRHPAARGHVTAVVDRLVEGYGATFIKMDCNTMTGPGSDRGGIAPGHGLLEHNRVLLDWIDEIQARHPALLIESCASGAMRMDYATLSRLHLQSTSDQQDPVMYAPIAAAAPASILPEQAGNWAYPRTGTSTELFTLSLVNGVLGRMYLSGYLNVMTPAELALVQDAVAAHRALLPTLATSTPFWPLGLPGWEDGWVALGLRDADGGHLSVWRRPGAGAIVRLPVPHLRGTDVAVDAHFPRALDGWTADWDAAEGVLRVTVDDSIPADVASARVLRLTPA